MSGNQKLIRLFHAYQYAKCEFTSISIRCNPSEVFKLMLLKFSFISPEIGSSKNNELASLVSLPSADKIR